MRKKIIGIDMDDTACHLVKKVIEDHNKRFPTHSFRYEDVKAWDFDHLLHPSVTSYDLFSRPGLYEELEVFDEHAIEQIQLLHDEYDIVIITAAFPHAVQEKWNWIQKHLSFIPYENFFSGKRKNLLKLDLLIDDAIHNLVPAVEEGIQTIGIRHPWNEPIQHNPIFNWVDGWANMKEKVAALLKKE